MVNDFTIIFEKGEQGWWMATIPEVPGAISQGKTQAEARMMVKDCAQELMAYRRAEALKAEGVAKVEHFKLAG